MLSVIAETRLSAVLRNPVKALVTLSDTTDTELSEMERAPVKTLPTTSEGTRLTCAIFPAPLLIESVIETTSDRDLETPLPTTSEIVDARFSDVVLNPVKTLDAASDTVGISVSVLNPVKTLPATSETATTSDRDFTRPLFTTAEIVEARFSDVVLNPVKTLDAVSDTVGISVSVLNPAKTLPTTSEGTRLTSANLPPPFLRLNSIHDRSLYAVLCY